MFEDEGDLADGEEFLALVVASLQESPVEGAVQADPLHEQVDGGTRGDVGGIGHGKLALAVDFQFHTSLVLLVLLQR